MKIAIIGSGNAATVLGKKIKRAGHTITQIYSYRNRQQATALAVVLGAEVIQSFSELDVSVDICLVAVSDSALPDLADVLPAVNGILVHTAGAVSMDVLKNSAYRYGVLYPLQSLRKEKGDYDEIPLLIDGNSEETIAGIRTFADSISKFVQRADDTYRLKLHAAAVVVSNFTNHLYSLASDYCQNERVDFHLLLPLITETADRLHYYHPQDMQTGPAIRNDEATIIRHQQLLETYPQLQKLYKVLTESIQGYKQQP